MEGGEALMGDQLFKTISFLFIYFQKTFPHNQLYNDSLFPIRESVFECNFLSEW